MRIPLSELSISLVGLGYVGLPIAVAFSKVVPVIGFDLNDNKINRYKQGIDPTNEVGDASIANSNVYFTSNPHDLQKANFHIVAVPTPITQDKKPDLEPLRSASCTIGQNLKAGSIVVYESTVYPGVTEEICLPILEQESGLLAGRDFFIGYSPERINPGDQIHRLNNITKIVSGQDEETLHTIAAVYQMVVEAGVYEAPSIRVAEAAKVIENSQRDINIAFMNELSIIFHKMNIDTKEILKAAGTKWNFLPFEPGLVGGHCIGVDPYYLTYKAEQLGYHSQIILSGRQINDDMGRYIATNAIKSIMRTKKDITKIKIAILGLTFKENCPDIRNTRVIDIVDELKEYGINPAIYDPLADPDEAKKIYNLSITPLEQIEQQDCIIVAVAHQAFQTLDFPTILAKNGWLFDVKGMFSTMKNMDHYWQL